MLAGLEFAKFGILIFAFADSVLSEFINRSRFGRRFWR